MCRIHNALRPALSFDHCYTIDRGHRFMARLAGAGFTLDPAVVEHPGRHVCRFIPFAPPGRKTRQYLEFISKPANQGNKPGLSLSCEDKLEAYFNTIKRDRFLRPTFEHRNYDWKTTGKKARELGWNFVHFRRNTAAAEIWLTEYERADGKKPQWEKRPRHKNGALGIVGVVFEANATDRRYFERILGRKTDGTLRLACGTRLTLESARRTRFRGILIKSADFKRFCAYAKPDGIFRQNGRRTAVIKNPSGSWDLWIV